MIKYIGLFLGVLIMLGAPVNATESMNSQQLAEHFQTSSETISQKIEMLANAYAKEVAKKIDDVQNVQTSIWSLRCYKRR